MQVKVPQKVPGKISGVDKSHVFMKVVVISRFWLPGGFTCMGVCVCLIPFKTHWTFPNYKFGSHMTCFVLFCLLRNKPLLFGVAFIIKTGAKTSKTKHELNKC